MDNDEKKFAVLIDADNVSPKYISYILDEVSDVGIATYKRIYGDWTDSSKRGWKDVILQWSVNPIQQYNYTTGKNSTDSAMIIDAMDILYSHSVDGFCLVSSDSDFTKLAQRLREAGMFVLGMGESKTPRPFRTACDTFKILDVISQEEENHSADNDVADKADITSIHEIKKAIFKTMTENTNQGRSTGMAELGSFLAKKFSEFDVRNYGYSKLSTFLESFDDFEIVKEGTTYYVRDKRSMVPKEAVEEEIRQILEKNNGQVDNLSIINEEVKKAFPGFHAKQYGFSRFSNFIRSLPPFELHGNTLRLRSDAAGSESGIRSYEDEYVSLHDDYYYDDSYDSWEDMNGDDSHTSYHSAERRDSYGYKKNRPQSKVRTAGVKRRKNT